MFRKLMSFDEAKQKLNLSLKPKDLGEEEISLLEAHGRVLKEKITSTLDIPPFNRSTVDGYAVISTDTFGAEENQAKILNIVGTANVGERPEFNIVAGQAVEIVTGAPIPEGADAVVMVEDTDRENTTLRVYRAVAKDENVMKKGADIKKGEIVLKAGQILSAPEIGVLAALGNAKTKVFRIPIVAVVSTGAEVAEAGKKLPYGKIYDINAFSLGAATIQSGGKPVYLGVVPDNREDLHEALKNALGFADIVITSGGVSVGPKDFTPEVVGSLGKPGIIIHGIAVKPGKPTTIGLVDEKPIFSLPGHPTSALLMFHLLVRPFLQLLSGRSSTENQKIKAKLTKRLFSARGRRTFIMVNLNRKNPHRILAAPVETGASGAITTLAKADGFVEIPENHQFVGEEEEVEVTLLE